MYTDLLLCGLNIALYFLLLFCIVFRNHGHQKTSLASFLLFKTKKHLKFFLCFGPCLLERKLSTRQGKKHSHVFVFNVLGVYARNQQSFSLVKLHFFILCQGNKTDHFIVDFSHVND